MMLRQYNGSRDLVLIPRPMELEYMQGSYRVTHDQEKGINIFLKDRKHIPGVALRIDQSVKHPQGYLLQVENKGISASASTQTGLFHAVITLRQLLRQKNPAGQIPCCRIEDRPDFPVRGVMLDISRDRVPTMETIFRLVDLWAELKLNQVQLYTEHTFAYSKHRKVWEKASPFTGEEIERLDAYCRARSIDLVPNQNSFGHMERWLVHPEYRHLAESQEGFVDFWGNHHPYPFSLYPGSIEAIDFLRGLYDELLPHFSSRLFNVGCDETFDLDQGKSREECRKRGTGRVYLDFLLKIHEEVTKRGKIMQFWGDIILRYPELIPELPADVIAMNWGYEADHPFQKECRQFADTGIDFYVCPGTSAWNSIGGILDNARMNLQNAAVNGLANGACGYLITEWGDYGHWQQFPVSLPGFLYGAAVSWRLDRNRDIDIAGCLSAHIFQDRTGRAAQALLEYGNAYLDTGVSLSNSTVFLALFFDDLVKKNARILNRLKAKNLSRAEEKIRRAMELVQSAQITSQDHGILGEELLFTGRHLLHACALGKARLATPGMEIPQIPEKERKALAAELEEIIETYKNLWHRRSRPGGLTESAGRLQKLLAAYQSNSLEGRVR